MSELNHNSNRQPAIRFKGFTDPWEQRKSKDLFTPINERNREDLPVLSVTQDQGVVLRNDLAIDIKYDKSTLSSYKVIHPGDFVISLRSFQGGFELSKVLGISSPAYTIFDLKNLTAHNKLYWKYIFKSFKFIESLKTVTFGIRDGKSISFREFSDLKINYPSDVSEQEKIGSFFKQLDDTIALHQRKVEVLQNLKKALLQRMFASKDNPIPDIRFAGFTDPWEQRKLGDLAIFNPRSDLPQMFEYVDLESVTGTNLIKHRSETKASAPSRAQRLAQKGDLFYQIVRPYQKNNYLYELPYDNYVFSTGYAQLRPKDSGEFLLALVQCDSFVNRVLERCTGTGYPAISSNDLSNIIVTVPTNPKERYIIGKVFDEFDHLIALHQRKVEVLQDLKKALLQKMFI